MRNKILYSFVVLLLSATALHAQTTNEENEGEKKGFDRTRLFTGGSVTASFFSGGTVLGINPHFGYQLAPWADAGVAANYTYSGSRDNYVLNDKLRQHVYGGGVFARVYPARMIFLQAQLEHNFTSLRYSSPNTTSVNKFNREANSLLVGAGLAQGRQKGDINFFYLSLLVDVLRQEYSPYTNPVYDNQGNLQRVDLLPIFRAGINIGLFKNRYPGEN